MLKRRLSRIALSLLGLTTASCSDSNPWMDNDQTGGIAPIVKTNLSVSTAISTRAEEEINGPAPEEFSLRISKSDGSYSKEWKSIATFSEDEGLRSGDYIVEAFYGDKTEEGAAKPAFYGFSNVKVLPGEVTPVEIETELSNSMVSVEYTDAFRNYFKDWSIQLHSDKGNAYVDVPATQTEPTYLHPGRVSVTVNFTKWDGTQSSIQPASFTAEARHHYYVKLDVNNGDAHSAKLIITFDDALSEDPIIIDLNDLGNAPAPELLASATAPVEVLQGTRSADPMKFTITAYGGLAEANISVASDNWTPRLGKAFNLCGLNASQQAQVAADGFDVVGIFGNASKMAVVDMSGVVSLLPSGTHTVTMQVKDALTQVSEPVSMTVTVVPVELSLVSVEPYTLNTTKAVVNITYNGVNPKEDLLFKATNDNGVDEECKIVKVETTNKGSGAYPVNSYCIELQVPACFRGIPIRLYQKAAPTVKRGELTAKAAAPAFDIETDVYATSMLVRATDVAYRNHLHIDLNGTEYTPGADGVVRIKNLTAATEYPIKATLGDADFVDKGSVTTEAAAPVPNGDFAQTQQTINENPINSGGKWSNLTHWRKIYTETSINVYEPTGWASVNKKTCYEGSRNKNTWFMVPSTFMEGTAVVLRSVAYDHNGQNIQETTHTNTDVSNRNAPDNFESLASRTAGELFLGTYSFDGTEHRTNGIAFSSRPKELIFNCKEYNTPAGDDHGIAEVTIYASDGSVVASGKEIITATKSGDITIQLTYSEFSNKKAAKLEIRFRSSESEIPKIRIPNGTDLVDKNLNNLTVSANEYKALSTGSVLKISNVRFTY